MSLAEKIAETIKKHGRMALGVHISLSLLSYTACYFLARYFNLNSDSFKKFLGKDKPNSEETAQQEQQPNTVQPQAQTAQQTEGQQTQPKSGPINAKNVSTGAVAYVMYKALMPVRIPMTIAVVTFIAKFRR